MMRTGRIGLAGILFLLLGILISGCDSGSSPGCGSSTPTPYISAAGIGVSNLERSMAFYSSVLKLDVAGRAPGKMSRIIEEVTLTDRDGTRLYLMDFGAGEDYKDRPVKLVFAVPDAQATYNAVLANGGRSLSAPTQFLGSMVALTYDPDGYIVELIGVASTRRPVLTAVGVGARDLATSRSFYEEVIGLNYSSGMPVTGLMDEEILDSSLDKGLQLVIMQFEKPKNYLNVPAKVVFGVDDAAGLADAIARDNPANIIVRPTATGVGYAKDIEGTLLEIVQE